MHIISSRGRGTRYDNTTGVAHRSVRPRRQSETHQQCPPQIPTPCCSLHLLSHASWPTLMPYVVFRPSSGRRSGPRTALSSSGRRFCPTTTALLGFTPCLHSPDRRVQAKIPPEKYSNWGRYFLSCGLDQGLAEVCGRPFTLCPGLNVFSDVHHKFAKLSNL